MPLCRLRVLVLAGTVLPPSLAVGTPARADFFDDARRTFTSDIPHFFQDDVPCAFGGRPTSHTRAACPDEEKKARQPAARPGNAAAPQARPQR